MILSASASTITKVQLITVILALAGILVAEFNLINITILLVSFYLYSIIGVSLTLHRYYSHKTFEFKSPIVKWMCTAIAVLSGRGSPLGWVYVHRLHHAYSDQDKDPHSPHTLGFKLFGFRHIEDHSGKMKVFLVKDLMSKEHIFINKWYFGLIIAWLIFLSLINIELVYFAWILPVMLVQLSQNCFNYFAHMHGYRNFETRDTSTNNIWLWPFIWGDAWHNNHHSNAAAVSTKVKPWELDPIAYVTTFIKK